MSPAMLVGEGEGSDSLCERACQLERSILQTGELTRRLSMAVGSSVACVGALRRPKSAGSRSEKSEKGSDEVGWLRGASLQSCKALEGCTEIELSCCSAARDSWRDEVSGQKSRSVAQIERRSDRVGLGARRPLSLELD